MKISFSIKYILFAVVVQLFAQTTNADGTFRFLNLSLPEGSTTGPYYAVLLTANAVGPVSYELDGGSDAWPAGLTMNPLTGEISGQPSSSSNVHMIIKAVDDNGFILLDIPQFKINSSGGTGGAAISTSSLVDGRVGVAYTPITLGITGGTGPFIWGVQNLAPGLSLNASTGEITGTLTAAGTFNITFSLRDTGATRTVYRVLTVTVLPADLALSYNFRFETTSLVNGEVGTAYSDTYLITDEEGTVTFSASGLPAGLTLDPATGIVSGTPTTAGSFYVSIGAADSGGASISTNLQMWIAPSSASTFYWSYFGIPAAIVNQSYTQTPNINIAAVNGAAVTYAATGLPAGISYNTSTGELTGTPTEIGVYPATFTATDATPNPDEILTLSIEFVVLPATGGDANRLPNKLWAKKIAAKIVDGPDNDSWSATYIYNDDRTTAEFFNPAVDVFEAALGSSSISIPAGTMIMDIKGNFSYATAAGVIPAIKIKGSTTKQSISVSVKGIEIGVVLPTQSINNSLLLGTTRYRIKAALSSKGQFKPTASYRNTSFVVSKGNWTDSGTTVLNLTMNLADPAFQATQGDNVILNIYDGVTLMLSKDVTSLVSITEKLSTTTGVIVYTIQKASGIDDLAPNNIFSKMKYSSAKGVMTFSVKDLDLPAAPTGLQAHLTVELVIGDNTYTTDVTFFETEAGSFSYTTAVTPAGTPPF